MLTTTPPMWIGWIDNTMIQVIDKWMLSNNFNGTENQVIFSLLVDTICRSTLLLYILTKTTTFFLT